jgi:hypothetical protein
METPLLENDGVQTESNSSLPQEETTLHLLTMKLEHGRLSRPTANRN